MAKPEGYTGEDSGTAISEFAVLDEASLGWSPAEHVVVHPNGQEVVAEFYAPNADSGEEASVIEIGLDDVTAGSLLVDIDGHDADFFSLNELLNNVELAPELAVVTMPDGADSARSEGRDEPRDTNLPENTQISAKLEFPTLTVVIDDDPVTDTVVF
jgi:hypothetical protein